MDPRTFYEFYYVLTISMPIQLNRRDGLVDFKCCSDGTYISLMSRVACRVPLSFHSCRLISITKTQTMAQFYFMHQYKLRHPVSAGASNDSWSVNVVEPSVKVIKSFLDRTTSTEATKIGVEETKLAERDLWTRYVCEACGNRELRGAHEWEQHRQGRSHRKRASRLRKSGILSGLTKNTSVD